MNTNTDYEHQRIKRSLQEVINEDSNDYNLYSVAIRKDKDTGNIRVTLLEDEDGLPFTIDLEEFKASYNGRTARIVIYL